MDLLIKAAVIGAVAAVITLVIKKNSPELALLLALSVGLLVIYFALSVITDVKEFIETMANTAGLSPAVISPVLKAVGIGIITKIASDISRDAGQSSIASSIELMGSAAAIYIALPLMKTVFQMIGSLI